MSDKKLYYTINGIIFLINIIVYFGFCNNNTMVKALISGLSWKWLLVFFCPLLFVSINELKKLSEKFNWEDKFIYVNELLGGINYILGLLVIILSIYNLVNSFEYLGLKVVFVFGIGCAAFNIYHLITGKEY